MNKERKRLREARDPFAFFPDVGENGSLGSFNDNRDAHDDNDNIYTSNDTNATNASEKNSSNIRSLFHAKSPVDEDIRDIEDKRQIGVRQSFVSESFVKRFEGTYV